MSQNRLHNQPESTTTASQFTPKFSASLVARFPALEQSKRSDSRPRQTGTQHKLLKRVVKPQTPQTKRPKERAHVPHSNKYLRRPIKHTFSGRVHDLNVAKIIKTSSLRNGPVLQSISPSVDLSSSTSLEAKSEDRLRDFASKQFEFREYMQQQNNASGGVPDTSDHSRSVSPVSVADSVPSISSRESSPGIISK
ncbi:hypothetical protein CJU90_2668 [Yarrowia sp. C11]|nr:hypothetical protein CJU90_2668 [Yarrowia sp. C11]